MDVRQSTSQDEAHDRLLVAVSETCGLARVQGRGSYKTSPALKQFAARMVTEGKLCLVVDLKQCEGMDSTFMGTLAGISQRLQKAGGSPAAMTSVSSKLQQLMKTLGLDRLVHIQKEPWAQEAESTPLTAAPSPESTSLGSAEHILEAHETLVDIEPENLSKFQDCLEFLRADVRNRKG